MKVILSNSFVLQVCCPIGNMGQSSAPVKTNNGNLLPAAGTCGLSTADRIVGGFKARIDEYPWLVLLEYSKRTYKTSGYD
jgi:hypothetical protein